MAKIETAAQLAAKCKEVAQDHKTLYVLGTFGWPMTAEKKTRAMNAQAYNRQADRKAKINAATADTFGFDCVGLIKAVLWGWSGDRAGTYGGATYTANGVPDIDADQMIRVCKDVSADFSTIQEGEVVWLEGHIGVYIGDGLAVECTPKWEDGVQITAVHNIGKKSGYNGRKWTKHGKLPYVTYAQQAQPQPVAQSGYTVTMRNLRYGCRGEDVRALQILLNGRGYSCGDTDGIFGAKTEAAVRAYQGAEGLAVDGIAGHDTMTSLMGGEGSA